MKKLLGSDLFWSIVSYAIIIAFLFGYVVFSLVYTRNTLGIH